MTPIIETNNASNIASSNDPIVQQILSQGTTPNRRLYRRWVTGQTFEILRYLDKGTVSGADIIRCRGYKYQWRMMVEEFRVQAELYKNDPENFAMRNRWFNKETLISCFSDYISALKWHVETLRKQASSRNRGRRSPYVTIRLKNREVRYDAIISEVYQPLYDLKERLECCVNIVAISRIASKILNAIKDVWFPSILPDVTFQRAFLGSGAYFTMRNLILFHGFRLPDSSGDKMSLIGSLSALEGKAECFKDNGEALHCEMIGYLRYNNIDIEAKKREWAMQKAERRARL